MLSYKNGIGFGQKLTIDPSRKICPENVIISHGHSDHVKLNSNSVFYFSEGTKAIVESRYSKVEKSRVLSFGKKEKIAGFDITMQNSGHILGSSSILVEGEKTVGVTSDFKLQNSLVQRGALPMPCDTLVIESTFGIPSFTFPEREKIYEDIGSWIKENSGTSFLVLAGYSLGKAQELTAICNEYGGITPLVHESVFQNNEVYKEKGIKLGDYIKLNHNLEESPVLIMPPSLVNHNIKQVLEYGLGKRVLTAFASGWSFKSSYNKLFPLSDHADFPQLLDYVKQCNPKLVLTEHGYARELAGYIRRRLKIPAKPLSHKGQKVLGEFC